VRLGFNEAASHQIVDIAACPVADPALVALLPPLHTLVAALGRAALDIALLALPGGIDMLVHAPDAPNLADREALAGFAAAHDLARLAWQQDDGTPEPIAARRAVRAEFGGVSVELPPGVFLQATASGERAIVAAVLDRLAAAVPGSIADFFAGAGTLSLPIAATGRIVHAVDGDAAALAALDKAARHTRIGLTTEVRDIERRAPSPHDLASYAALVFDPPRTGAAALTRAIAGATIPLVVAVSCNPETFARDARTLVDAGYALGEVQPIDQFLWSPHIELVAALRRMA
jgi:23S rRNA (uracil1939-C5)-methyltransferase